MITPQVLAALENASIDTIRRHVRGTLERTPSFRELPPDERRKVAHDLVRVLSFLSAPYGGHPELAEAQAAPPLPARGLDAAQDQRLAIEKARADSVNNARKAATDGDQASKGFDAAGADAAGEAFETLTAAVDFPGFVASLIDGVFTSIVNTSIKQMQEFGKFLDGVVKSVNQFAQENVTPDEARDFMRDQNPGVFKQTPGPLALLDSFEAGEEPDFKSLFGSEEPPDLSDEEIERRVARSSQLQLARMRQQQLATLVMLGINRIVVTEGEIRASVQFDVSSVDRAKKTSRASMNDTDTQTDSHSSKYSSNSKSFWGTGGSQYDQNNSNVRTRVSSVHADSKTDSETKVEAKAKLAGSVLVKFKSETFPLERLASQLEMGAIQEKSKR
jgi:hypothetical protein